MLALVSRSLARLIPFSSVAEPWVHIERSDVQDFFDTDPSTLIEKSEVDGFSDTGTWDILNDFFHPSQSGNTGTIKRVPPPKPKRGIPRRR